MTPGQFVPLGRVVKTHGLKGEVSVMVTDDLPFALLSGLEVWFVPPPRGVRSGRIEGIRQGPKGPLFKVSGIGDVGAAQFLVGAEIIARAEDVPSGWLNPPDDEDQPVGIGVTDTARGYLGEVTEVIVTGANDVWVVDGPLGEILLPVIDDVILDVDFDARTATVKALDGLLPSEDGT